MEGSKFKTQQIRFEGGQLKLATEERSKDLKEGQVLIKVRYAPVTRFDKERLSVKPIPEKNVFGMEGCGIIEEVGPGVDQSLKGKKCAFCSGGW
jgi:NADPH:quinone reductase-like Zn-dependent oxidoreductase